jgi:hypothetical protein
MLNMSIMLVLKRIALLINQFYLLKTILERSKNTTGILPIYKCYSIAFLVRILFNQCVMNKTNRIFNESAMMYVI